MREIKFKAWDEDDEEWVDELLFNIEGDGIIYSQKPINIEGDGIIHSQKPSHNNLIVMQFTGLKDKNGKEIFEGDIVKFSIEVDGEELLIMCKIIFEKGCFLANWREGMSYYLNREDIEVIGNIYENPELLEKGEEKLK